MKKFIFQIRLFLYGSLFLILIGLSWLKIVPNGRVVYSTDFLADNFFIRKLTPIERVNDKNTILSDPVYFSLFTPRGYDKALITLEYEDNPIVPLLEAGVMVGDKKWSYRMAPLQNNLLDSMPAEWSKIQNGDLVLWQKKNNYQSVAEFLGKLPAPSSIALYNYDLKNDFQIENYQASSEPKLIDKVLRGRHELYTYIKDEKLFFAFTFQDLNENREVDKIVINLYQNGKLLKSWQVADDGVVADTHELSAEYNYEISVPDLATGTYKLEISANDDILIKKIVSNQSKISFAGNLNSAISDQTNFSIYSDTSYLSARTNNPKGLQEIKIGDKTLNLTETYKQYLEALNGQSPKEIKIARTGISLAGNGVFAFSPQELINPDFKKVDQYLDISSLEYILAKYNSPLKQNNYKVAQAELDLSGAYHEKGQYSFMLSSPGYQAENGQGIKLKKIKIELTGKSLWQKLKEIF